MNKINEKETEQIDNTTHLSKYRRCKFTSIVQIDRLVDEWLKECKNNNKTPTLPNLALALKFNSVKYMSEWKRKNTRLAGALIRAYTIVEERVSQLLLDHCNKNSNGPWRYLQSAYHYTERSTVDNNISDRVVRLPSKGVKDKPIPKVDKRKKTKKPALRLVS